jgi:hypothetical protein
MTDVGWLLFARLCRERAYSSAFETLGASFVIAVMAFADDTYCESIEQ